MTTCPFCGAGIFWQQGQTVEYTCNTRITETGLAPVMGRTCLETQLTHQAEIIREARKGLEILAKLGNEPLYGTSDGNRIAQSVLFKMDMLVPIPPAAESED